MTNIKKISRIGVLLLVLCLISTTMTAGTFAKYTSEYAGADTALVARWEFKASDDGHNFAALEANPQTLDLFSHDYETHINQIDGEDYIIAPGVNDEFTIKMTFLSDVDAKVTVDFTKTGTVAADLPIEYLVEDTDGNDGAHWVNLAGLNDAFVAQLIANTNAAASGTLAAATVPDNTFTFNRSDVDDSDVTTITQKVKWRWAFDADEQTDDTTHTAAIASDNDTDTGFGNTSAAGGATRTNYILNVSVTAEQIAPTTTP